MTLFAKLNRHLVLMLPPRRHILVAATAIATTATTTTALALGLRLVHPASTVCMLIRDNNHS
jgi:hypothetical protein